MGSGAKKYGTRNMGREIWEKMGSEMRWIGPSLRSSGVYGSRASTPRAVRRSCVPPLRVEIARSAPEIPRLAICPKSSGSARRIKRDDETEETLDESDETVAETVAESADETFEESFDDSFDETVDGTETDSLGRARTLACT